MDATEASFGKRPPPPSQRVGIEWLTPEQIADELQVSLQQLERWRNRAEGGPPWYRFGPRTPRYLRDEVNAWAMSKRQTGPFSEEEPEPQEPPRVTRSGVSVLMIKNEGSE